MKNYCLIVTGTWGMRLRSILAKKNRGSAHGKIKQIIPANHEAKRGNKNNREEGELLHLLVHDLGDASLKRLQIFLRLPSLRFFMNIERLLVRLQLHVHGIEPVQALIKARLLTQNSENIGNTKCKTVLCKHARYLPL